MNKIDFNKLNQQDYLLTELTAILNDTDKVVLVDMVKSLAALAADAEQPETIEDFYNHINSKLIVVFYASHEALTGARPSAAVLKALDIEASDK